MEDMSVIRKCLQHERSYKRRQTTLDSFLSSVSGESNTLSQKVDDHPTSKRQCISSIQSNSTRNIRYSGKHNRSKPKMEAPCAQQRYDNKLRLTETSIMGTSSESKPNRTCPFYKRVPDTKFTVDAFRYGIIPDCNGYFLSHFHSDHYLGLSKRFQGTSYCSRVTANLVIQQLKVPESCIHALALDRTHHIEGVEVTLMEANHCPGAVLLLFRLASGRTYLHTGDFRYNSSMLLYPQLLGLTIHELYLDTTYCDPQYDFPKQVEAVSFVVEKSVEAIQKNPKTLIVCGTYTIGKEKVFQAIAEALSCEVCVTHDKKAILDCLESNWIAQHVTTNPHTTGLHVLPIGKLNITYLSTYLKTYGDKYTAVLAFKPTGWSYRSGSSSMRPHTSGAVSIHGVPYSEHSSYTELREFVQFLKPLKIIPTVNNGSAKSRDKMHKYFREWLGTTRPHTMKKQTTLFESFKVT